MSAFFVSTNVANLYAEPNTSSELVTQAVSGARVQVREENGAFRRVETEDRYQGWVAARRLTPAWDDADYFQTSIATLFADVFGKPDAHSEMITKLVVSTRVRIAHRPEVDDFVPVLLPDKSVGYVHKVCLNMTHDGSLTGPDLLDQSARRAVRVSDLKRQIFAALGEQATRVGRRLIGTPYLWGGCTPFGIDCSGFVQLAYKLSGVQLLRDADLQFGDRRFRRVEEGQAFDTALFNAGDLVVFGREGRVTHIGMALGDGRFIHSSGARGVAIDPCDNPDYVTSYLGAVSISPDADLAIEAA